MSFNNLLIFLEGLPGSGKTQLMTFFSILVPNYEIYSNYWLDLDNYTELTLELFDELGREDNTVPQLIHLDEGYTWIEARTSMATLNRYMSHKIFQKRKRNQIICVSAQTRRSIDNRFRALADIVIKCKEQESYYQYTIKNVEEEEETGNLILKTVTTWRIPKEAFEFLYGYYDTFEILDSPDSRDLLIDNMTHEKVIALATKWMKEMYKIQPVWSKPSVEAYLWHNGESIKLAKPIIYEMAMHKLSVSKTDSNQGLFNKYKKELHKIKTKWGQKEIDSFLWRKEIKNPNLSNALYYFFKDLDGKNSLKKQGEIQAKLKAEAGIK